MAQTNLQVAQADLIAYLVSKMDKADPNARAFLASQVVRFTNEACGALPVPKGRDGRA